jgi:hypothetical protein
MVSALASTLQTAVDCSSDHRDQYARMVLRGFDKAAEFSWEKNASEYSTVYQMVWTN